MPTAQCSRFYPHVGHKSPMCECDGLAGGGRRQWPGKVKDTLASARGRPQCWFPPLPPLSTVYIICTAMLTSASSVLRTYAEWYPWSVSSSGDPPPPRAVDGTLTIQQLSNSDSVTYCLRLAVVSALLASVLSVCSACPRLFILFLCLCPSLRPFQLYFIP